MVLEFVHRTEVRSPDVLTEVQREQLRLAGIAYDGFDLSAADRLRVLGEDEDEDDISGGASFLGSCYLWQVVNGDQAVVDAWFYAVDSGSLFRTGSTELVAEVIQFGLQCKDPELYRRLGAAIVRARVLPSRALRVAYREFAGHDDQAP